MYINENSAGGKLGSKANPINLLHHFKNSLQYYVNLNATGFETGKLPCDGCQKNISLELGENQRLCHSCRALQGTLCQS